MDLGGVDVWGQIALETSQMYVSEGGPAKSRTVSCFNASFLMYECLNTIIHLFFTRQFMQSSPFTSHRKFYRIRFRYFHKQNNKFAHFVYQMFDFSMHIHTEILCAEKSKTEKCSNLFERA